MRFRASFCDPFKTDIIELGEIPKENVISKFESIPWTGYLQQMQTTSEDEIHFSPSLEVENMDTKHSLSVSVVGEPHSPEFYIFYKRPKSIKSFFGLSSRKVEDYTTDITGQNKADVIKCLEALIEDNTDYLADKITG